LVGNPTTDQRESTQRRALDAAVALMLNSEVSMVVVRAVAKDDIQKIRVGASGSAPHLR